MSYFNLYEKALEHDLEEIQLLARAARTAPPPVRQALLGMIKEEAQGAKFWNTLYSCCGDYTPPCPEEPDRKWPCDDYYPYQEDPKKEKKE